MTDLTPTLSKALNSAISAYKSGNLVGAEQLCQQIVAARQDVLDALHLLALVQSLLGKKETAVASFDGALRVRPDHAEALSNLGLTLHELTIWRNRWGATAYSALSRSGPMGSKKHDLFGVARTLSPQFGGVNNILARWILEAP